MDSAKSNSRNFIKKGGLFITVSALASPNTIFALDKLKNEHKKFGKDGFSLYVNKVADIEKQLNIFDLSLFTPK